MKRIVLIRNSYSYDFGGAEIYPINLAKILSSNDFNVTLLSSNKKTLDAANMAKIKTSKSPWWSRQNFRSRKALLFPIYLVWNFFVAGWYFVYILRNKIDVVHPQSRDDFISATIAAKILGKRVVWTDHADLKHVYSNQVWYKNPIGKLVYLMSRFADSVTIISNSEKILIEESLGKKLPKNYIVIYLGVKDIYKPIKRNKGKLVFVATSRLVKDKGIAELIEAFKHVNQPNVILKLCGNGPDVNLFKSQASSDKNIHFLGHVSDVTQVLLDADIFMHPTYHEGFGLSLVEAEMCGLPIIASHVGSIPEIVTDNNGILIRPKNSKALAEAMILLIKDEKLRLEMGKNSRQIYLNKFRLDMIVKEKIIPLYGE